MKLIVFNLKVIELVQNEIIKVKVIDKIQLYINVTNGIMSKAQHLIIEVKNAVGLENFRRTNLQLILMKKCL